MNLMWWYRDWDFVRPTQRMNMLTEAVALRRCCVQDHGTRVRWWITDARHVDIAEGWASTMLEAMDTAVKRAET